jgi:diguanylate cyclase (GGDEF)-like protein
LQIRRLGTRIAFAFALLLLAVEAASLVLINSVLTSGVNHDIQQQLAAGERVFNLIGEDRSAQLAQDARVLSSDFGFREAIATHDHDTVVDVLSNHGKRINADIVLLVGLDQRVIAETQHPDSAGKLFAFPKLVDLAQREDQATAFVLIDGKPYELVVVPVKAPLPIAWFAAGMRIDDRFAENLKSLTALEVSFLTQNPQGSWTVLASTLEDSRKTALPAAVPTLEAGVGRDGVLTLDREDYVTHVTTLGEGGPGAVVGVLQKSQQQALATLSTLQRTLLVLGALSLLATVGIGVLMARNMTRPLSLLSGFAQRVEQGDYSQPLDLHRHDEIGELASAFNLMRTGIAAREVRIADLANQDVLTGLPNRTLLRDRLEQAIKASRRSGETPVLLIMDLDRFKEVNDSLGHHIGDLLLQEVSQRLVAASLRESDTVARLGGDEFAILLPASDVQGGSMIARKLLDALELPILLDGHQLVVAGSIGVAVYPEHGEDANTLMRRADAAMYAAKRANSGFAIYDASFEGSGQHLSLMAELRQAMERNELMLFYQPKVALASGEVHDVEALLRWRHPERGFISPAEFIPFAERTGFIKTITHWVVEQAVRQAAQWQSQGLDLNISINVSARDLVNPELPRLFDELATSRPDTLRLLSLEITESTIMADPAHAQRTLEHLHQLGLRLSVDDFGTGYSSLAYLKKLPVDELKIDQSFVLDMLSNRDDAIIVRSTIDLGHNMGLKVVAEGVQDAATCRALQRLGCDFAQGFHFSRALPASEFEAWLAATNCLALSA